jgi:hypothetical protein
MPILLILCYNCSLVTLFSWSLLYSLSRDRIENPASSIITRVSVLAKKKMFNAPLPSDARIHSFRYSGCNNITTTLDGKDINRQVTEPIFWRSSQAQYTCNVRLLEWKAFLEKTAQNFNRGVNNLVIVGSATKLDIQSESIRFLQDRDPLRDWRKYYKILRFAVRYVLHHNLSSLVITFLRFRNHTHTHTKKIVSSPHVTMDNILRIF